jgi:hypothetical protein
VCDEFHPSARRRFGAAFTLLAIAVAGGFPEAKPTHDTVGVNPTAHCFEICGQKNPVLISTVPADNGATMGIGNTLGEELTMSAAVGTDYSAAGQDAEQVVRGKREFYDKGRLTGKKDSESFWGRLCRKRMR